MADATPQRQNSESIYQRLNGAGWRHIWVVGDLHGCHQRLMQALHERYFDPSRDLLVCVGDLIDRGPDSLGCLGLLQEPWFATVRGNHEQMAIEALQYGDMAIWQRNGGNWFPRLNDEQQQQALSALQVCAALPYVIELHCEKALHVVAHADYPSSEYQWQKAVNIEAILWNRERVTQLLSGRRAPVSGADYFWFGHTPLKQRLDVQNLHYIDTGAVFGGELTLAQLQ